MRSVLLAWRYESMDNNLFVGLCKFQIQKSDATVGAPAKNLQ